jgi:hypothetical protein
MKVFELKVRIFICKKVYPCLLQADNKLNKSKFNRTNFIFFTQDGYFESRGSYFFTTNIEN